MRAIYIFVFFLIMIIQGCTTIEVAKEVTKATSSVKKTIENISRKEKKDKEDAIIKEKEDIVIKKTKEEKIAIKQKEIVKIEIIGKTIKDLTGEFGRASFERNDGNTKTLRYDTRDCRIFIFFNLNNKNSKAEYYEIRNLIGSLIEKDDDIKNCLEQINSLKN